MAEDSDLRRRTNAKENVDTSDESSTTKGKESKVSNGEVESQSSLIVLEALRIIIALTLVSFIASYLVTRGESWIWNFQRPWWTQYDQVRAKLVSSTTTATCPEVADKNLEGVS